MSTTKGLSPVRVLKAAIEWTASGKKVFVVTAAYREHPEAPFEMRFGSELAGITEEGIEQVKVVLKDRGFDFSEFPVKPNCRVCIHARKKDYTHHLYCAHPEGKMDGDGSIVKVMTLLKYKKTEIIEGPMTELMIIQSKHGQEKGWCTWPLDFDPIWLENCDGFEEAPK